MGARLEVDKSLIEPVYPQAKPNESINLGDVKVQFSHNGKTYQETAQVIMQFLPNARLLFVIPPKSNSTQNVTSEPITTDQINEFLGLALFIDNNWDGKLKLTDRGVILDVFATGSDGEHGSIAFMSKKSAVTVMPKTEHISTATFHLFNFPEFVGPDNYIIKHGTPPHWGVKCCGRSVLRADGWFITIAATNETDDLCKALKTQGEYVITHVGEIQREDGSAYTSDQLDDLMHCLHHFLSFVLGRWAGLALPLGFDKAGKKVFEQWGLPSTDSGPWRSSKSWFDEHHGELLAETFPGFLKLWKNSLWHTALWKATYWYLLANGSNNDASLILAQTALELLAWTYCVEDRKMVSAHAFGERGLSAADKLRILASTLDIPVELPAHLDALNTVPGRQWQDAMDAITSVRNALVHPHTKTKLPDNSYYEAGKLSLWYLDLILLRLCGHKGKYGNRLAPHRWSGNVEAVPWAKNESEKAGA